MTSPTDLLPYLPNMRRYARALTRDPAAAEDLVQDATLRALEKMHLYQPGTDLRAWLFTIVHNVHASATRSAARRATTYVPPEELARVPAPAANPLATLELRDLRAALAALPRSHQRLLVLSAYYGEDYEAMASYERIPLGTVRSRLSRARAHLRLLHDGVTLNPEERDLLA